MNNFTRDSIALFRVFLISRSIFSISSAVLYSTIFAFFNMQYNFSFANFMSAVD